MFSKKLFRTLEKESFNIIRDSIEARETHARIKNEISTTKKEMEERRKNFKFIRNK